MSDFVNNFWSIWITVAVVVGFIGLTYLIWSQTKAPVFKESASTDKKEVATTGHCWDGDLEEYHNPLPRWWMLLFYITLIFGVVYFALYPGLGSFKGFFNWTSVSQYNEERAQAEAKYKPLYDQFMKQDVKTVAHDPKAQEMGKRLFQTYCMQCHGADAKGSQKGFPNLTDSVWNWGGSPDEIHTTIADGRHGIMAPWGEVLGEEKVKDVAEYVLSLSKRDHDAERATRGKETFAAICIVCHGPDGKGNKLLGAPDLTDNNWVYSGSRTSIITTITNGRNNQMPAWKDFLGEEKVHLLTAYVWGLSNVKKTAQ